jgi:hypothetical protein
MITPATPRSPAEGIAMNAHENPSATTSARPESAGSPPATTEAAPPAGTSPPSPRPGRIGRYRVEGVLGEGGFGRVYLAHDDQLGRPVAIKVPHLERVSAPEDAEAYLAEARVLAGLDHPHVVPVHDVGRTEDGLCFVVSKLIEGSDLSQRLLRGRPPFAEAARLVAAVADALHHAHLKGLVHRDVKPANVLLDPDGKPYLADFGLALREEDFGKGGGFAGTPAYMSPEQARRQGHRVDGRADVFSLGVVLYELLTGRRPFRGDTRDELLNQILTVEARPPRQIDDAIPRELERICLKALAKRPSERYTTARDMAEDLERFRRGSVGDAAGAPKRRMPLGRLGWVALGVAALLVSVGALGAWSLLPSRPAGEGDGAGGEPQAGARPGRPARATLEVASGLPEGKTYELAKDRVVIGRAPDCDVTLASLATSRYHAQLVRGEQGYLLEDLGSSNGTYVNGHRAVGRVPLADGDRIHVGPVVLVYRVAKGPTE